MQFDGDGSLPHAGGGKGGDAEAEAPHAVSPAHDAVPKQRLVAIGFDIGVDLECSGEKRRQ